MANDSLFDTGFNQELYDTTAAPPPVVAPVLEGRLGAALLPDADAKTPEELVQHAVNLADQTRKGEAEDTLHDPSLPLEAKQAALGSVANDMGKGDKATTLAGVAKELAAQGEENVNPVYAFRADYLERTARGEAYRNQKFLQFEKAQRDKTGQGTLGAMNYYFNQGARSVFLGDSGALGIVNTIKHFSPDFDFTAFAAPADALNAFRNHLSSLPEAEMKQRLDEVLKYIDDNAGTIFPNRFDAVQTARSLTEGSDHPANGWDNVFHLLGVAGAIPSGLTALRLGSKTVRGIGKLTESAISETLKSAEQSAAAIRAAGTSVKPAKAVPAAAADDVIQEIIPEDVNPNLIVGRYDHAAFEKGAKDGVAAKTITKDVPTEVATKKEVDVPAIEEVKAPLVKPIPESLKTIVPRVGEKEIVFQSEVDEALYQSVKSTGHSDEYIAHLKDAGLKPAEIKKIAEEVVQNVDKANRGFTGAVAKGTQANTKAQLFVKRSSAAKGFEAQTRVVTPGKAASKIVIPGSKVVNLPRVGTVVAPFLQDLQKIPVGTVSDAVASSVKGAKQLVSHANTPAGDIPLHNLGIDASQVTSSLITPKAQIGLDLDDLSHPYVTATDLEGVKLEDIAEHVNQDYQELMQLRLKDTNVTAIDGEANGFRVEVIVGDSSGTGYLTKELAVKAAKLEFTKAGTGYEILPVDGQYYIRFVDRYTAGIRDIKGNEQIVTHWYKRIFGSNSLFTAHYHKLASQAARGSDLAETRILHTLAPYSKLSSFGKAHVNQLLDEGDRLGEVYDIAKMNAKGVTNPKLQEAYLAVRHAIDETLASDSFVLFNRLKGSGFRHTIKIGNDDIIIGLAADIKNGEKAINLATGNSEVISAANKADAKLYKFFDDTRTGEKWGFLPQGQKAIAAPKPLSPVGLIQAPVGYLPRHHNFAYTVRNITAGKTLRGARSQREANKLKAEEIAKHLAAGGNAGDVIDVRRVTESLGNKQDLDELQAMKDAQLMYNHHRSSGNIVDIHGDPRLQSVEKSIAGVVRRYAEGHGVARYTDVGLKKISEHYENILDAPLRLGYKPRFKSDAYVNESVVGVFQLQQEVLAAQAHIELVNGLSKPITGGLLDGVTEMVARNLWNAADVLGPAGAPLRVIGNNVGGISDGITRSAKTAAFVAYLGSNPIRNFFLQSANIPTYLAVDGAMGYALTGKWSADFAVLGAARVPGGEAIAARMNPELVKAWKASGEIDGVSNHALTLQTLGETRLKNTGLIDDVVGTALRVLKKVGFDQGIGNDKSGAWLISLNKFRQAHGGKYPATEAEHLEVYDFSERLTLSQNRADPLQLSQGLIGVKTQFLSYQAKQLARMLGLEAGFSKAEKAKFWAFTTLSYGFDGYKLDQLIQDVQHKSEELTGIKWDPEVVSLVNQGLIGALLSAGHPGTYDVAGEVGPGTMVGPNLNYITELFGYTVSNAKKYPSTAPALGLGEAITNVVKFGMKLVGQTDLPAPEVATALAAESFRLFPMTSNLERAYVMGRLGFYPDANGNPVVQANLMDAMFALAGVHNKSKDELDVAMKRIYGESQVGTFNEHKDGLLDRTTNLAKENSVWLMKAINDFKRDPTPAGRDRALKILDGHTARMAVQFQKDGIQSLMYYNELVRIYDKNGILNDKEFAATIIRATFNNRVTLDGNLKATLEQMKHLSGAKEAIEAVDNLENFRHNVKQMLQQQIGDK